MFIFIDELCDTIHDKYCAYDFFYLERERERESEKR